MWKKTEPQFHIHVPSLPHTHIRGYDGGKYMVSRLIKTYQSTEEEIVIMTKLRKKSNPVKVISGLSHSFIYFFPPSSHTYLFYTHNSRCVHMEQDIWNWKVFPDQVFIAGIWWFIIIISSKNFHIIEGLVGITKLEATNQFSINC